MSTGYQDNIVEEIKSKCDIVDVIGRHVTLKKTGSNYKGVCPFHNEKTPSFVVSETKQIFTCFGCGATGDVIEFVKRYHNHDFQGAIEQLAGEYGIEIKRGNNQQEEKKSVYYEINRQAAAFFYRNFTQRANRGYSYMKSRDLDPATLRKFGIGYADEEWDSLYRYFMEKGIDVKLLLELGLVAESKGRYYDKFRDRVIFPIINTRGKVVGFGGRAIGDAGPKYLNSPESIVFYKKNNLYGLNLAREDINKGDYVILVEGYMDVISLYKYGIRNVTASLGTALTEGQATMLKRYTSNVILSYDADSAGQNAALTGVDILHKAGCKAKILRISDGKDPDEFVKNKGKEAYLRLVKEAMPRTEFKLRISKQKYDLGTTEGSISFLQEAADILRELKPVEADIYIQKLAKETHISEGAIRMEVYGTDGHPIEIRPAPAQRSQQEWPPQNRQDRRPAREDNRNLLLQKNFIRLTLMAGAYTPRIIPYEEVFDDPVCRRIFGAIKLLYREDEEIDRKQLADSLEPEEDQALKTILEDVFIADRDEAVFADCVAYIEAQKKKKREEEIIRILSLADEEGEMEVIEELTRELMELQRDRRSVRSD